MPMMRHLAYRLNWTNPGQDAADIRSYLGRALLETEICLMVQDASLRYRFVANLPDCWAQPIDAPPTDVSIFGEEIAAKLSSAKKGVAEQNQPVATEIECDDRIFKVLIQPVLQPDGTTDTMSTIIELTAERHREKVLKALLREVSHRSKNLLAIIHSIATQTARNSSSLPLFLARFTGRLFSLAQSQDLVTDSSWRGAFLFDLARGQLEKYLPRNAAPIEIKGENVHLSPNEAIHVGLAIHELAVNSASYGALSHGTTAVDLRCNRIRLHGTDSIEFIWSEDPGPGVPDLIDDGNDRRHFGSVVLERVVPVAVDGISEYDIGRGSVSYRLVFPANGRGG